MKAISLKNITKRFIVPYQQDDAGRGLFNSLKQHKPSAEFLALKGIDMEIDKGRIVGVIGRNGAGKSTLLNILAGVSTPTTGEMSIDGKVSSLLTLGAGFQDELTGRENIYLNSSILGMSRSDVDKKCRDIIEFSELGGFLDFPLQAYSQGMRLRLGFSIAIHMDFDILLIDEILSVGDVSFQKKCFSKIEEFKSQGKTLVIITQSMDIIERICEEAYLLENGEIIKHGHPQGVIGRYIDLLSEKNVANTFCNRFSRLRWWSKDKPAWPRKEGTNEAKIVNVNIYNSCGKRANRFKIGERIKVEIRFLVCKEVIEPHFGVAIFREDGVYCYGPNTSFDGHKIERLNKGKGFFSIEYKSLILKPGRYRFSIAVWDKNEMLAYDYHVGCYRFAIAGDNSGNQLLELEHRWDPDRALNKLTNRVPKDIDSKTRPSQIELISCELIDASGSMKNVFSTGEDLKIKIRIRFCGESKDYYMWAGLFRGDDIFCHGSWSELKSEQMTLNYSGLPLLKGDYYLSIAVCRKHKIETVLYKNRAAVFSMSFSGQDHGTVYLEHNWDWAVH